MTPTDSDRNRSAGSANASTPDAGNSEVGKPLPLELRAIASFLLVFHLTAIVVAPWAVAPASMLSRQCWDFFQPYLEVAYLNHGYHFFAPEPGPSHLVRYELELPDGTRKEGVFPNREQHKPRLLYHRHFMFSEFLNTLIVGEADPELVKAVTRSYANRLLAEHDADRATLYLRRHYIPTPDQVLKGTPLDDLSLYAERPLGTFRKERV